MNLPHIRKSNEMMVRDLMEVSPYGALAQVFIIEAIRYYSERVAAQAAVSDPGASLDPAVWHEIAKDVLRRLEHNYNDG